MVFSGNSFLLFFFPLCTLVYYLILLIPHKSLKASNIWLLAASVFFYAWGEPVYVYVMLASMIMNWVFGKILGETIKGRKAVVAVALCFNVAILFVFKYLSWLSGGKINIALPIGISFYTFQSMSFILDTYRHKYDKSKTGLLNVALYISFFPQLIAGPIVRFTTVADQINNRKHSFEKISQGFYRFATGLAKKVLLANKLAQLTDLAFNGSSNTVVLSWIGAAACIMQIYFDFSGYSDMAIGLGKIFGFEFNENFNYPFISKSVTEYWRRWHISLGEWFRDYLFYPLSIGPALKLKRKLSSKISPEKAAGITSFFVLFIVWAATGIWHGANLTFLVWGMLQFVCIMLEKNSKPIKGFCHVRTLLICILGGVLFQSMDLRHAGLYFLNMFALNNNSFCNHATLYWIGQYGITLALSVLFSMPVIPYLNKCFEKNKTIGTIWEILKTVCLTALFIFSVSSVISNKYNPFIYFNF